MRRLIALFLSALVIVSLTHTMQGHAAGFNTGMVYRYPFANGVTMTRTQGQDCACPDHDAALFQQYAVDWDNGVQNWNIYAANSGTLTCHAQKTGNRSFGSGVVDGVHDPLTAQASVYLHLESCAPYQIETPERVEQGFLISHAGTSGGYPQHLHFQVDNDPTGTQPGPLVSIPFAMSDRAEDGNGYAFLGTAQDGPSDNVGVSATAADPFTIDQFVLNAYWNGGGGQADSWWNVGASYQSVNDNNDEFGGPCQNATAFVHVCGTNFGIGFLVAQNYFDWKNVRHSIMYDETSGGQITSGHVSGAIQGALSNPYGSGAVSRILGAPIDAEANGRQDFQGGYIQITIPGVRAEVNQCNPNCHVVEVTRYAGDGTFCPSVNLDGRVDAADVALVDAAMGTSIVEYDLNGDGTVNILDHDLLVSRESSSPCPGDADGDGLPDGAETGIYGTNPNNADTDGDGIIDGLEVGQYFTNPLVADTDGDGCGDGREVTATFASLNPNDPWDFYSVPVPALFAAPNPRIVFKDSIVSGSDGQAVFSYFKAGANSGTQLYDQDLNGNGVADGIEYDRTVAGQGGASGPPDGVISATDAQLAFAQFRHSYSC